MAIRVGLHHVTRYIYDRPVTLSPHVVRLRPAPHCRTTIAAYSLKVTPEPHFVNWQQDPFGNYLARFVFHEPAREVRVEVDLVADLVTINPFDFFLEEWAEKYPFEYRDKKELEPYLPVTGVGARFDSLLAKIRQEIAKKDRRMVDVLVDVNMLIQSTLRYDIRMEPGVFAPEETLERGHGSCRDFAWLMVNVLRGLGLAARFVSGYSIQLRPDQKPLEGPIGVLEDCTDLHAWAEAYLPGAGWIGLDATSGLWCGEGHLPLACTAEPSNAAAITGSYAWDKKDDDDEIKEDFSVEMKVTRLEDRPRPTRSYTEEQWQQILQAGDDVERVLQENDVRLTMGGEPTFVSADDMESAEWSTDALGPTKARLADELLRRLRARYAPGSVLHHGQGKWYPGEQLPRWAYGCYWRSDGVPVWQNVALLADGKSQGHGPDEAATFIRALVNRLGVGESCILPAYEDVWYFLWREHRLPANVDPFDSKLEDELERARLSRVFSQGLSRVVGWALPLRCDSGAWQSGAWHLRDQRLYLLPGDSPMGLRLPLDSLPWSAPQDLVEDMERDPFAPRPPLPRTLGQTQRGTEAIPNITRGASARDMVRTALCVESRDGVLHVFLPPVYYLEHYLDLIAHVEQTAGALKMPVRLEGYPPPRDPRLLQFSVTPDPGVIEVNIHPAHSWRETVERTSALYEEARLTRLGTDKFMLDGRHTGTGGGNHVVLGGPTPDDSPLLRRPDLLRSFSAYFNNHPALSYLFSSLFVGPTSQAPRVDEARQDALYDLEVAYGALSGSQPWLGDRLFRHLFVDVTGNTHRTAMCIDKLFSPDHAAGRQGLLELRSFEMPPDARMSLAQQLLVRALVAKFWRQPYTRPLQRWGTALHDRFMLPHFVWEDMQDICGELSHLDVEWFRPHWEFRFPRYGSVAAGGVELELRQAIEPWHVLGEEPGAGGTVRFVDSSVERLQVLVNGLADTRHVVYCNKRQIPLHPTGRAGEYVAGVRFKAWKPPSSLHPTLPTNAPLVFDIVDTWNGRAIGGCTYHVAHPGGRSYDVYPKNGLEAESRRVARFAPFGHSPGAIPVSTESRTLELPFTLDLRI